MNRDFAISTGREFARSPGRDRVSLFGGANMSFSFYIVRITSPFPGPAVGSIDVLGKKSALFSILASTPYPTSPGIDDYAFNVSTGASSYTGFTPIVDSIITSRVEGEGDFFSTSILSRIKFQMNHLTGVQMECEKRRFVFHGAIMNPMCVHNLIENWRASGVVADPASCLRSRITIAGGAIPDTSESFAYDPVALTLEYGPPITDPTPEQLAVFTSKNDGGTALPFAFFRSYRAMSGSYIGVDGAKRTISNGGNADHAAIPPAPCCDLS